METSTTTTSDEVNKSLELFSSNPIQPPIRSGFFMVQVMFRILAIAFMVASISIMVTSGQHVFVFGIPTMARYSYSSALKFLLAANAVVSGFSVLSLIFVCVMSRSGAHLMNNFYLFLHDMVMMVLLTSGCAAATAIGYVSRYGEKEMAWVAVCDYLSQFCNHLLISVVLSYLAFFCYIALTAFSAHKFMSSPTD